MGNLLPNLFAEMGCSQSNQPDKSDKSEQFQEAKRSQFSDNTETETWENRNGASERTATNETKKRK